MNVDMIIYAISIVFCVVGIGLATNHLKRTAPPKSPKPIRENPTIANQTPNRSIDKKQRLSFRKTNSSMLKPAITEAKEQPTGQAESSTSKAEVLSISKSLKDLLEKEM